MTSAKAKRWNHYYVAYGRAHGRTPEAQLAHDTDAFPGGRMAGYLVWIRERWQEWRAAKGYRLDRDILSEQDHADFGAWLATRVSESEAA